VVGILIVVLCFSCLFVYYKISLCGRWCSNEKVKKSEKNQASRTPTTSPRGTDSVQAKMKTRTKNKAIRVYM
jgi:hypothetical protein